MKAELKRNFPAFFLIACVTAVSSIFILAYCELFYDFGNYAKDRLLHDPVLAFFTTPLLFWISAYLCRRYAPNAAGSNIEHVRVALLQSKSHPDSFEKVSPFLSFRVLITNAVSSLISTFGGGALGREGPSYQMSAGIFAVFAERFRKRFKNITLESWILIGSAIGLALAFHAPLAAFVCVAEKLFRGKMGNFRSNSTLAFFATLVIILIFYQSEPLFAVPQLEFDFGVEAVLMILSIGIFCGVTGFFFKKINAHFYQKFAAIEGKKWHFVPLITGFAVSIINSFAGIYSFSGGIKTANDALANAGMILSYKEVFGRFANTILTFISGCAGGLVAPSVTIGAGIGSIFSTLISGLDAKIFILTGMVAFLSPLISLPFTASMLILESTAQSLWSFPFLLFSAFVSFFIAAKIEKKNQK